MTKKLIVVILLLGSYCWANTYSTTFASTQTPLSEGGMWVGGTSAGSTCSGAPCWGDIQVNPANFARAIEPQPSALYNDPTAILTGTWGPNQTVTATVSVNFTPTGSGQMEVEVRARNTITAGSITGYEGFCSAVPLNRYCAIARWNGPGPNGTSWCGLANDGNVHYVVNNDVMKMTVTGTNPTTVTLYINNVQMVQVVDHGLAGDCAFGGDGTLAGGPYTSGNPGIGFYGGWTTQVGISAMTASDGVTAFPWQGVLASPRAIDWSQAGVVGGVPSATWANCTTAACNTVFAGTVTSASLQSAINSAPQPGPSVVRIPAGIFTLTAKISMVSNVVLRGAGANQTFLTASDAGDDAIIQMVGNYGCYPPGGSCPSQQATWTGGYAQGNTQITLTNVGSGGVTVGNYLYLTQKDDTTTSSNLFVCADPAGVCSAEGGAPGIYNGASGYSQMQLVKIVSCVGTCPSGATAGPVTVNITPLYFNNWRSAQTPVAWWNVSMVRNAGVEDLSLDATNGGNTYGIHLQSVNNCWIARTRLIRPAGRDIVRFDMVTHVSVQDNYFYGGGIGGSTTYAIEDNYGSDNLSQNNIYHWINVPHMMASTVGSVVAYNFAVLQPASPNTFYTGQAWEHDAENAYDLYEGNTGNGFTSDIIHGNSNFDTLFRNRFYGSSQAAGYVSNQQQTSIVIAGFNRYHNIVGNVLGSYNSTQYSGAPPDPNGTIYNLGPGNNTVDDPLVATTTMRWGNYDKVTAATRFCTGTNTPITGCTDERATGTYDYPGLASPSTTLPVSFYLSSEPTWFGSQVWPPIGPDKTSGNGVSNAPTWAADTFSGGHSNLTPSLNCYKNVMGGPADGSGSALTFNPGVCYYGVVATQKRSVGGGHHLGGGHTIQ